MNLSEYLATNPADGEHSYHYLLISEELRDSIIAKQDAITTSHHIGPVLLIDGRYGVCCDLYTEVGAGGIYQELWGMLDKAELDECEVVDKAELLPLLPPETEEEE